MVFSINAVESGPNNFAAFQALAKRINGTAAPATTSPTPAPSTPANGALSMASASYGAMMGLVVVAITASLL